MVAAMAMRDESLVVHGVACCGEASYGLAIETTAIMAGIGFMRNAGQLLIVWLVGVSGQLSTRSSIVRIMPM